MKNKTIETAKKEIRATLRDKKSLMMMLIFPIMIPIFIFIFSYFYTEMLDEVDETSKYNIGINYELTEIEKQIIKELNLEPKKYETEEEMKSAFDKGEIDAYVTAKGTKYKIYANDKSQDSSMAGNNISTYLDNYNTYLAQNYLSEIDADLNKVYANISYKFESISNGSNDMINYIVNMAFVFIIMAISLTATYCATDSIAGEKEKGTLETILTFPIKSDELIAGKYLAITVSCIITAFISMILTIGSFSICKGIFDIYEGVIFKFNPVTIITAIVIMISYSIFISGAVISIASFSKTYKEAQSALTPISLLSMILIFLSLFGVETSKALSLIPVISHTMLLNDLFIGKADVINVAIMFISSIIYIIILIKYISKQYKSEKILFSL